MDEVDLPCTSTIVLLMDVIEHIEDDVSFLASLRSALSRHGYSLSVIITVPAYDSLYCSRDEWLGHYRRYSQQLLTERIAQAGFVVADSGYFFTCLLLPRLLCKVKELLFGYNKNAEKGIGDYNGNKWSALLIRTVLKWDYFLGRAIRKLGIKPPGLSCYCVCRS
jgi:hypothetical protein